MILFLNKSKCEISESLNGEYLLVKSIDPIEFTGGDGNEYILYDECEEGIGPAPKDPFVVENPRYNRKKK